MLYKFVILYLLQVVWFSLYKPCTFAESLFPRYFVSVFTQHQVWEIYSYCDVPPLCDEQDTVEWAERFL